MIPRAIARGAFIRIELMSGLSDRRFNAARAAERLAAQLAPLSLSQRLQLAVSINCTGVVRFTTSFGLEDQAVTHAIALNAPAIEIVTIDTVRLFPETHVVWAETEERYPRRIRAVSPAAQRVEAFVVQNGINGFRDSIQNRLTCCGIRKSEPLRRALAGASAWITGLRSEQSDNRRSTPFAEFDDQHALIKINPLADWTARDVARYVRDNRIPYNALHDRGFPSIGCAPCTRAVRIGGPTAPAVGGGKKIRRKNAGCIYVRPKTQRLRPQSSQQKKKSPDGLRRPNSSNARGAACTKRARIIPFTAT